MNEFQSEGMDIVVCIYKAMQIVIIQAVIFWITTSA